MNWETEQELRRQLHQEQVNALFNILGDNVHRNPAVIANYISECKSPYLMFEWIADYLMGHMVEKEMLPWLQASYDILKKEDYQEGEPVELGGDNRAFYIPHDKYKIIVYITQNYNYLYIWDIEEISENRLLNFGALHIRTFWKRWKDRPDIDDKWTAEEEQEYAQKGIHHAIAKAHALNHEWADDYDDNQFPYRLSLHTYKKYDFKIGEKCTNEHAGAAYKLGYGDCRDNGYVLSYKASTRGVDRAAYYWPHIYYVGTCYINSMWVCLTEMRENERL